MAIVVMGSSGAGKSTVAADLALKLRRCYLDADNLHSAGNVVKLSAGIAVARPARHLGVFST